MKIVKEVTAKQLLTRHCEKLAAEMPDVYEVLVAISNVDGTPFEWPGPRISQQRINGDEERGVAA